MNKRVISWLALGAFCAVLAAPAAAQPSSGSRDTVRIVVPFAAGGPTDFMARQLSIPLARYLGKTVLVDNRPGASGNIGTQHVADSRPDGLTLVHTTAAMQAINPMMYPDAGYDPVADLVPIAITGALPNILVVHPNSGINTVKQLVDKGKAPGAMLNFATFGPGSSPHFYGSLLKNSTGIEASSIAYKGSAHAITDMLAGRLDFTFDSMTTSLQHVKAGKLKGLAITSHERSPLLPELPTLKETGYGGSVEPTFWLALQVAKGTDPAVVASLREAVYKAIQDPEYRDGVAPRGVQVLDVPPARLEKFVKEDTANWVQAAKSIGIKPE